MPQHHMVIPHYMGRNSDVEIENKNASNGKDMTRQDSFLSRSSYQDIPLLIPQEPNESSRPNGVDSPHCLSQPNSNRAFPFRKTKIEPVGPDTPMRGFVDDFDSLDLHGKLASDGVAHPAIRSSVPEWWETQERGNKGGLTDESGQVGPCSSCRCQVCENTSVFLDFLLTSDLSSAFYDELLLHKRLVLE